ncbi:MAG: polysaccharide deacetylase family protein, partial [Chloroflexota bacterium]
MDCEQIRDATPSAYSGGPSDWAQSERAITGFVDYLETRGFPTTLFVVPATAGAHPALFRALQQRGCELGMHLHPQRNGYGGYIGDYTHDEQLALFCGARELWASALDQAPRSFRSGNYSANDATFAALVDAGFQRGSVSCPGREYVELRAVWRGADPWPHFTHAANRLLAGPLDFYEIPHTTDPDRMLDRYRPYELRLEMNTAATRAAALNTIEFHRQVIRAAIQAQIRQGVPIKALVPMRLFSSLIRRLSPVTVDQLWMLNKAFHWFLGLLLLLWIHRILDRHVIPSTHRVSYFAVFIYTALLLPTNALALKVLNYDLLSMLLGLLAILHLMLALSHGEVRSALLAIGLATLAAQEKLIASPIVLCGIVLYGYLRWRDAEAVSYRQVAGSLLIGFGVSGATSAVTLLTVAGLRHWNLDGLSIWHVFDATTTWVAPIYSFSLGRDSYTASPPLPLALSYLAVLLASVRLLRSRGILALTRDGLLRTTTAGVLVLVALTIVAGYVGTYHVSASVAPMIPIAADEYRPPGTFNGTTVHFGSRSVIQHLFSSVAHAYAVFVGQIPVGSRYLNIALFATALTSTVGAVHAVGGRSWRKQLAFAMVVATGLVVETLPFRPVYAAFRPIWAASSAAGEQAPQSGRFLTAWSGWGEEVMLAGEEILRRCAGT